MGSQLVVGLKGGMGAGVGGGLSGWSARAEWGCVGNLVSLKLHPLAPKGLKSSQVKRPPSFSLSSLQPFGLTCPSQAQVGATGSLPYGATCMAT